MIVVTLKTKRYFQFNIIVLTYGFSNVMQLCKYVVEYASQFFFLAVGLEFVLLHEHRPDLMVRMKPVEHFVDSSQDCRNVLNYGWQVGHFYPRAKAIQYLIFQPEWSPPIFRDHLSALPSPDELFCRHRTFRDFWAPSGGWAKGIVWALLSEMSLHSTDKPNLIDRRHIFGNNISSSRAPIRSILIFLFLFYSLEAGWWYSNLAH